MRSYHGYHNHKCCLGPKLNQFTAYKLIPHDLCCWVGLLVLLDVYWIVVDVGIGWGALLVTTQQPNTTKLQQQQQHNTCIAEPGPEQSGVE